jgi:hypothetical protein
MGVAKVKSVVSRHYEGNKIRKFRKLLTLTNRRPRSFCRLLFTVALIEVKIFPLKARNLLLREA